MLGLAVLGRNYRVVNASAGEIADNSHATRLFLRQLEELPPGARAVLFDVGSNKGSFAASMLRRVATSPRLAHIRFAVTMVEPQVIFADRLSRIAAQWTTRLDELGAAHNASLGNASKQQPTGPGAQPMQQRRISARLLRAVAAAYDGHARLYRSGNSEMASTLQAKTTVLMKRGASATGTASTGGGGAQPRRPQLPPERVRAVDLSRLLREAWDADAPTTAPHGPGSRTARGGSSSSSSTWRGLPHERPLIYLKMDIEGGEASLLPRLLVSGALCYVSFLRVEWHLNTLDASSRLSAVGLKHTLRSTLMHGCAAEQAELARGAHVARGAHGRASGARAGAPPLGAPLGASLGPGLVIESEEYRPVNFGEGVPGLLEETVRHYNDSAATEGVGGHASDALGIRWRLTVHKAPRRPAVVLFRTESALGVDRQEVLPGTNVRRRR